MGNLREQEIHSAAALGLGFMPGEIHYCGLQSGVPYGFWRDDRRIPASRLHTNILDAYDAVGRKNGNNNVIVLSPDSHSLGAALVLNKNMTHICGAYPPARMNHRARFGMSTAFTPMITVSGYGNLFKNIYSMHGTAEADYIGWLISGHRNMFQNCHLAGPMVQTQADHVDYVGTHVTGTENRFLDCVFGVASIERAAANCCLKLGPGTTTFFENCAFHTMIDDTDPIFVSVTNSSGGTIAYFNNCKFFAYSSNMAVAMAAAFTFTGAYTAAMILDKQCEFINVSKLGGADGDGGKIWVPIGFVDAASDAVSLLSNAYTN
jgi:hypothetical protein